MRPVATITEINGKPVYSLSITVRDEEDVDKAERSLFSSILSLSVGKMGIPLYKVERDRKLLHKRISQTFKQVKEVLRDLKRKTKQNPVVLVREEFTPISDGRRKWIEEKSLIFPLPATVEPEYLLRLIASTPLIDQLLIEYANQNPIPEDLQRAVAVSLIAGSSLMKQLENLNPYLLYYDRLDESQLFTVGTSKGKYYALVMNPDESKEVLPEFAKLLIKENLLLPEDREEFLEDFKRAISEYSQKLAVISDTQLTVRIIPLLVEERGEHQLPEKAKNVLHLIEGYYTILKILAD